MKTTFCHPESALFRIHSLSSLLKLSKGRFRRHDFCLRLLCPSSTVIIFDHPHAHNFHLPHPKISQAMLRKWPTSEPCWPWLLAFYVIKEGRDEGKGNFGGGVGYKKMGKRCIYKVDGGVEARG